MNEFTHHWHGLACCEVVVNHPLGPSLFRRLGKAARLMRKHELADGALSSYSAVAAYWNTPPANPEHILAAMTEIVQECMSVSDDDLIASTKTHRIAVCYDGVDLDEVAAFHGLTADEIVSRHSGADYVVAAVGFLPHFAYLWGLDPSIATPRRKSPRTRVPAGSLGIAGEQTGVYPLASPGGWQLIGSVAEEVCREVCPLLAIGDVVQFRGARA